MPKTHTTDSDPTDSDAAEDVPRPAETPRPRINLSASHVAGSALAATSSAMVASYLGIAGTIAGAAIGSAVATTGTAVYGHAFRHGGRRIATRINTMTFTGVSSVTGDAAPELAAEAAPSPPAWTQTELPLSWPTATSTEPMPPTSAGPAADPPPGSNRKTRKPVALATAMAAVFGTALTVGLLAGGPVREAGTGYNFTRPQTVTAPSTTATQPPAGGAAPTSAVSPSAPPSEPDASGSAPTAGSSGAAASPSAAGGGAGAGAVQSAAAATG